MVEQIRHYCQNNNMQYFSQTKHYNDLLQAERDAHLESRLDRDHWHAQTLRCAEMIRTAYRLRCEEEDVPIRVVAGLQNEVRAYRFALGMEKEKPEEEYGWEILKVPTFRVQNVSCLLTALLGCSSRSRLGTGRFGAPWITSKHLDRLGASRSRWWILITHYHDLRSHSDGSTACGVRND